MKDNMYFDEDEFVESLYKIETTWNMLMESMLKYETILNNVIKSGINDAKITNEINGYINRIRQYKNGMDELYSDMLFGFMPQAVSDIKDSDKFDFPDEIIDDAKNKLLQMLR